jgi:4,5-dihydroxyphthalate decarboxylase
LVVRSDSGIRTPKDLEGKKVGVRAYSVTTGVWTRGILTNEYGVDSSKVTWVVDDEEHVTQLQLPANVVHVEQGKSLAGMMASGEIRAGFTANAGIGREGPPQPG